MGSTEIDIGLGDSSHADLVVGTRQEARKGGDKGHSAAPGLTADGHAHQVLLSDEALYEAARESILGEERRKAVVTKESSVRWDGDGFFVGSSRLPTSPQLSLQCQTPLSLLGMRKLKIPSVENTELNGFPFQAWSRSVYSHPCCRNFFFADF